MCVLGKMGPISHLNHLQNVKGKVSVSRARQWIHALQKGRPKHQGQQPSPTFLGYYYLPTYLPISIITTGVSVHHWPTAVINVSFPSRLLHSTLKRVRVGLNSGQLNSGLTIDSVFLASFFSALIDDVKYVFPPAPVSSQYDGVPFCWSLLQSGW